MLFPSAAVLLFLSWPPEIEVRRPYPDACEETARSIELSVRPWIEASSWQRRS